MRDDVRFELQPIYGRFGKVAFYEILGRIHSEDGVCAISPETATKYTKDLILFTRSIITHGFLDGGDVSINLSHGELEPAVMDMLCRNFRSPALARKVIVEVTEDVLLDDGVVEKLMQLKTHGFRIAIDDFCSEHSVRHLLCVPEFVDIVKLDGIFMRFVRNNGDYAANALHHFVAFVQALDKEIAIEHIETPQQLEVAGQTGAHYLQGFALSTPKPLDELEEAAAVNRSA
ncbi:EAL domain-containing protein [Thiomicrolovo sp. ZZH C-3]